MHGAMRTKSKRARLCPVCGGPMRKNGRTKAGAQRWKCPGCALSTTAPRRDGRRRAQLGEFLDWLLSGKRQWDMDGADGRAFRKRVGWCWRLRPAIPPDGVVRHVVMADGTYMAHGWCLLIAIDGLTGEPVAFQWCGHESTAAYAALFSRIPAPDVLVSDGLRGIERACAQAWPRTRIQRCLVHVQRNTRADLTSRPRLQAGRELKELSDALTSVRTAGQAAQWAGALNAWHGRWRDFIAERTWAKDDPANPKASRQEWWWTHGELRRCYRRLERLFREGKLFAFLDPGLLAGGPVPRTSNLLEGGINSLVKRTLLEHHGLPEEHMRRACEWRCYMRSHAPDPYALIAGLEQAAGTQDREPTDGNDDGYGDGIQANNHDDPTNEPGFYIRKGHVH